MDTIRLRTLAEKSTMWFGKYEGQTVAQIISGGHSFYLRWIYYNIAGVSFNDEILNKIYVPMEERIEKPGTNPEIGERLNKEFFDRHAKRDPIGSLITKKCNLKIRKARTYGQRKAYQYTERKGYLQAKNQGR